MGVNLPTNVEKAVWALDGFNNTLYAVIGDDNFNALYKTDDGGTTWVQILEIEPFNDLDSEQKFIKLLVTENKMYLAIADKLYCFNEDNPQLNEIELSNPGYIKELKTIENKIVVVADNGIYYQ